MHQISQKYKKMLGPLATMEGKRWFFGINLIILGELIATGPKLTNQFDLQVLGQQHMTSMSVTGIKQSPAK